MCLNVLSIHVRNHFGVLNRVTSIFSRRTFNIKSLTVAETENPEISRITILMEANDEDAHMVSILLQKQEDVLQATVLPQAEVISSELVLIKVCVTEGSEKVVEILSMRYDLRILDKNDRRFLLQFAGSDDQADSVIDKLRPYGLIDVCRTGIAAVSVGSGTIYSTGEKEQDN